MSTLKTAKNELRTARLVLRGPHQTDLADLHDILSDPRAMQYWSTPPHPDLKTTQDQLDRMCAAPTPITYFMMEHDHKVIGMAGMHREDEVGFILNPTFWRQGFVTEAMATIIPHLWNVSAATQLTADADPLNSASVGLLKSLGFHETHRASHTFCIDGKWSDSAYFALPRPNIIQ